MSDLLPAQLYFLLDRSGGLIVYQEKAGAWAGALGFSDEQSLEAFLRASALEAAEVVSLDLCAEDTRAALVRELKRRLVRNLLVDLDYATGRCLRVEFDGEELGPALAHQFVPRGSGRAQAGGARSDV